MSKDIVFHESIFTFAIPSHFHLLHLLLLFFLISSPSLLILLLILNLLFLQRLLHLLLLFPRLLLSEGLPSLILYFLIFNLMYIIYPLPCKVRVLILLVLILLLALLFWSLLLILKHPSYQLGKMLCRKSLRLLRLTIHSQWFLFLPARNLLIVNEFLKSYTNLIGL